MQLAPIPTTTTDVPPSSRRPTLRGFPAVTMAPPRARKVDVVQASAGPLTQLEALALQCRALGALAAGADVVVLDLAYVERLQPAALTILGRLGHAPRPVVLSGARPVVARAIRRASLHGTLDVFSSREAALRTLSVG